MVKKRIGKLITKQQFEAYEKMTSRKRDLRRFKPKALESALCVTETGPDPQDTFVMIRGNAHAKGPKVEPRFPSVLSPPKPEVAVFSGANAVRFFSQGGWGGGVLGTPSFRLAFTQSALLHLRNRFQPIQGCLQDAQNLSKLAPKGRQDPSNYIIHAKLVSSSCFNSSFIPLPSF